MSRAVDEWIGKDDNTPVPPRVRPDERGRGVHLSAERVEQMERFCAEAVRSGATQDEIMARLGASRSRVSRWTISGIRKHGAATDHRLLNRGNKTLLQMIWARIEVRGSSECWPWRGATKASGYGSINYRGRGQSAHRAVYELLIGDIPDGLVIDHTCRNPGCCNPAHLQVTTQAANIMLGFARRTA